MSFLVCFDFGQQENSNFFRGNESCSKFGGFAIGENYFPKVPKTLNAARLEAYEVLAWLSDKHKYINKI